MTAQISDIQTIIQALSENLESALEVVMPLKWRSFIQEMECSYRQDLIL